VRTLDLGGRPVTMYRTANTGGDGWLLRVHADAAPGLWRTLAACGASRGLVECGFEDVDLCKLENGVVNMEREGSQVESVVELRPVGAPMPDKADYVGRHAVERALRRGVRRRLVGLAVGRPGAGGCDAPAVDVGAPVRCAGADAGTVVNAAYSPGLGRWIATALLDAGRARPGLECHVGIDGSALRATTVAPPFVARGPRAA
jgi:aminomethyltransferase